MKQSLLARVQIWTIFLALAAGLVLVYFISLDFALGTVLTAWWAVAGLRVSEGLLRSAVVPPGQPRNIFAIILWGTAKLGIYGLAFWVLFSRPFPAVSHAVGFTLLMVVLVVFGAQARGNEIRQATQRGDDG